jgi:hypothetical protein
MLLNQGEYKGLTVFTASPSYLTDQRNFSNDRRAPSRMQSMATINFTDSTAVLTQEHRCDDLIECDLASGDVRGRSRSRMSEMKFVLAATDPNVLIRMDCKYSDLFGPPAHGIGEIEYKGTIKINSAARTVDVDLMIGLFPAFEGYAAFEGGNPLILFRHAPAAGILALPLPKGANRRIRSRLEDRDGNGTFELSAG